MDVVKRQSLSKRTKRGLGRKRYQRGEALISVGVGASILITIAFFILDLIVVVLANSANDTLARNAARAAANQQDMATAGQAANGVVQDFHASNMIPDVQLVKFDYLPNQSVTVETSMNVKIPAGLPFPCLPDYFTFVSKDTESIVGVPSSL
jgi:hypothetical protein